MKTVDFGAYIVTYNFVIGVLQMLSSEKVASYAACLNSSPREMITRLARTSVFTFGAAVSVLSGTVYIAFHLLRIGL